MEEKQILCVGLVVLDIINVVDKYPEEDTDRRCLSQRWQRGGNASNSCTVLSLLGARCAFMGSLAPGHVADFVLDDLRQHSVDLRYVVLQTEGSIPTSTVIINEASGSRTILHAYRFVHLSALRFASCCLGRHYTALSRQDPSSLRPMCSKAPFPLPEEI